MTETPEAEAVNAIVKLLHEVDDDYEKFGGWDLGPALFALTIVDAGEASVIEMARLPVPDDIWLRHKHPGDALREVAFKMALGGLLEQTPRIPNLIAYALVAEGWETTIDTEGSTRVECRNLTAVDKLGMHYWLCHHRDSVVHERLGDNAQGDVMDALFQLLAVT